MLLLALFVTFFFEGIAEPGDTQRVIGTILVGSTLMLALYAAELSPRRMRIACGAILVAVVGVVVTSIAGHGSTVEAIAAFSNAALVVLAPPAVVIGVMHNLRAKGGVTVTVVAGALCFYLLLGLFFAFMYTGLENLNAPFFANGAAATSDRSVYFSF